MSDDIDINDIGLDYSQMPVPKVCRKYRNSRDLFALTEVVAKHRQKQYQDLDSFVDTVMVEAGETYSLKDLIASQPKSKRKKRKVQDLKPIVFIRFNVKPKNAKAKVITIRALLDSGGSGTLISERFAKKLKKIKGTETEWSTPAGQMITTSMVATQFSMPELHDNRVIEWPMHVTKSLGAYDMIIGRDLLQDLKINLQFSDETVEWDGVSMPFKDIDEAIPASFFIQESNAVDESVSRLKNILDAKYEAADLDDIADKAMHLTAEQREMLRIILKRHGELFDGTLGKWKGEDLDIELLPDAKPYHCRAFPIPKVHQETLKLEVDRLVKLGVLKKVNRSEWAAPTFIIPKKDGTVRFISDFRELNKRIKRKPYPIPKIQDLLIKLEGFQHATSLDLNMGYYHIELTPDSKKLCTIVLPFGKYEHQRLPMGLSNSPDLFQEKMSELMADLEYVRVYLDDLLTLTSGTFEDHLEKLDEVFTRLRKAGLKINAKKSFFARSELEYLGYWISREGIQPLTNKVEAIQRLAPPKTKRQLRGFIGLVNFYRDMWIRRSHVLAPLAKLTSKTTKWKWGDEEQQAFDTMKRIIAKETLLAYPDFSQPFTIHTDASHTQLGAVISQNGKPIAFYSRKLNPAQTRHTTTERELLSIVETLKEFRNILLGHKIIVHTDHQNLTCKNFNTKRVMRWRLMLEEHGPELRYIKGERNIVADALSRLELMSFEEFEELKEREELLAFGDNEFPADFPLSYAKIAHEQDEDQELQERWARLTTHQKKKFPFGDKEYELITFGDRIVLPKNLQTKVVEWYHDILMHPGETRTEMTIAQHYYWHNMRQTVLDVCKKCKKCQLTILKKKKYAHLPEKEADAIPWKTLCTDLIGPYTICYPAKKDKNGNIIKESTEITLHCLTMIDPCTGWFEIAEIENAKADEVANVLQETWLTRYPWPAEIIMDRGREFMKEVPVMLKNDYGIKVKRITTRNPQANAMVERSHKTLHDRVRTQQLRDKHDLPAHNAWRGLLAALAFAMRATVHTTLRATPTQLVFNRDAIQNVGFEADWLYIKERKQRLIKQNNQRENAKRIPHAHQVGDQVVVLQDPNRKHGQDYFQGPQTVTKVNTNGTVQLKKPSTTRSGGAVYQTWNMRNVFPYKA